ncbi:unnamed protein product, partial [Caretta caretta]
MPKYLKISNGMKDRGGVPTTTPVLRMDSINGLSHNRDADFGDEEDEEEEVEAQQASGETIFPDSQELFFTPDLGALKQIGPIMQEYNDAVQRATRLSAARQNFLTGKKNPVNIVTQEDLVIYMQWLVCHLHSLKAIHSYLRVLQYLPISRRMEVVIEKHPEVAQDNGDRFRSATMSESLSSNIHFSLCPSISGREGPLGKDDVFTLPQHTTETEELKPQLHLLLSYFGVCYDTENLKNSANEMELFSEVIRKFRSVFSKQQTMRTFPVYDAGVPGSENWGILGPSMVLKKRANWIPFIKIKPKQDPWQQKLLTKLKQWKKVDELLHLQSKFLEDQNTEDNNPAVAMNEKGMEAISLGKNPGSSRKKKERGYSYVTTLQLLGLDEGTEANNKDLIMRKGAYLSVLYLRHLRIRDLQRVCLGILNYFRSVERTLTISTSGLTLRARNLVPSAEDTCWVNAVKGGIGVSGGLGSRHYVHYTSADFKVHSAQFMEFSEVENHDDFYPTQDGYIHTQDQRGAYIIYDIALKDLKDLENQLLLVASQYIEQDKNKTFLLDGYFEAYQHALDTEERFALAQAITDIMHKRPRFDLSLRYFVNTYNDECICLRLQLQLVREIFNQHIDAQREYVQKIWRKDQTGGISEFGLPHNIIAKQLISLNNNCPTLKNIYLLDICRPKTPSETTSLEKQVLQLAVDEWLTMEKPESSYSSQIQKDLFADTLLEDPLLVRDIAMLALESGAHEEKKQGREKQAFILDIFSRLLELITLRHRLIETVLESAQLAGMYKAFAGEMGFDEFHLYLRPVHFEFASHKEKADQPPPIFITALLEDGSSVDRYIPSNLLLSIQEIDNNQIGKFSFHTRDGVIQLLSQFGVENMQITLACQVTQKNALIVAVQQASFCHMIRPTSTMDMKEANLSLKSQSSSASGRNSKSGNEIEKQSLVAAPTTSYSTGHPLDGHWTIKRPPEAFVSIQLEKLGPRDMMLNTFIHKKEIVGSRMQNPNEDEKIKREVIAEYCHKLSHRMSQYALRGQIIAYYNSLKILLEDFPVIRDKYFMIGLSQEKKGNRDSKENLEADPRSFQPRPHRLLSPDGQAFLNLWFIPHPSEVLIMFKMLPEKVGNRHSFHETLVDISVAFSDPPQALNRAFDGGGGHRHGTELQELQKMIDSLQNPLDPNKVAQLLIIQREVMLLQFDAAVRHLLREVYLSSGNILAYQSVTDSMHHGLPPLSNSAVRSVFASQLWLPQLVVPCSPTTLTLFPWRAFLVDGGPFPVTISTKYLNTINYNMQLCLCRLSDDDRRVAHGVLVGMPFLMEDILRSSYDVVMEDHAEWQTAVAKKKQNLAEIDESHASGSESSRKICKALPRLHDPVTSRALLRSFLIIWKQLEVLKAEWGRLKLKVKDINTVPLYKQFAELYGTDILYPAMRAIARHMGTEDEFEGLVTSSQSILPPKGLLQKLLESLEIHMIHDVKKKINQEMTLVTSERARAGNGLPTELWKHRIMQENFSAVRPQIVETFVQRLMENYQESDVEGKLDDYRLNMSRQVFEIISEVRKEGVDNMIDLKKKFGSTKDDDGLKVHLSKQEQLQFLQDENTRLHELVCKLKVLSCWKQTIQNAQLSVKLRNAEKEALQNKEECLNAKMLAEQEVFLFRQQLVAKHLLQEVEHRMTQEARSRQQLDVMKAANMEKMLEDMGQKEQRLQCLTEDAEKSSRIVQLQQKRIKKEMRQIRSQLIQERSLKLDAFQRVDELQYQVYDLEAVTSQRNSPAGMKKSTNLMSYNASSVRRSLLGSASWAQRTVLSASTLPRDYKQNPLTPDPKGSNVTSGKTERPKTVPSRWRNRVIDAFLPDLAEHTQPPSLMQTGWPKS